MDDNKEIIEKLQDIFNQATECMKCRKDRSILRDVCKQVMEAFEKLQKQDDTFKENK